MQLICGQNLSKLVDYSFGDQRASWDSNLIGGFMKPANATNVEFLAKAKEFEGRIMTLYIDNIRLYPREVQVDNEADKQIVSRLMRTNNLLALCSLLPYNGFIIFTGEEDTPIDDKIVLPPNIIKIYAVNAVYNTEKIIPFPIGLQRQIGQNDKRLDIMFKELIGMRQYQVPRKLLYINCGIGRNEERKPLEQFQTNDWITTRFDKDSKFFPYERYADFLGELRDHKFIVCPKGHGFDTHRIWETLYMRRVPIMLKHPYFEKLLDGFSVLFVDKWSDITMQTLIESKDLYTQALNMDLNKLDLKQKYDLSLW